MKRKCTQGTDLQSRYFPTSPKRKKITSAKSHSDSDSSLLLATLTPRTKSRYFEPKIDIDAMLSHPPFMCFYEEFISAMLDLYYAKPLLIQGKLPLQYVSYSPWKVLVAVTLLNKTSGQKAIPIFFEVVDRWPTAAALVDAPLSLLFETIKDLGLGDVRSERLVHISQTILAEPPEPGKLRPSRGQNTAVFITSDGSLQVKKVKYPPTPISHIPGCGPYALDSYRIFCAGGEEWKSVRATDKELAKYLQWRWAVEAFRKWDQTLGPTESIDLDYVRTLTVSLIEQPIFH